MAEDQQIILDGMPKPGEPLIRAISAGNQQVIDTELAQRKDALRARLNKREHARLTRRYTHLHRLLNKRGYNRLILRRAEIYEQYRKTVDAYRRNNTNYLRDKALKLATEGKALNADIEKFAKFVSEFESVSQRLNDHNRVIDFEREDAENRAAFYREADVWEEQIKAVFRRSPRLRHVYTDKNGKEHIQIPIIEQAILKEDKVYFQIMSSHQNAIQRWFKLWDWMLPDGVDRRALTCDETLENLSLACGRIVTVEINKITQNVMYVVSRLDSADGIPNKVLYPQVIDFYPHERHTATPWPGGVTNDRKVVFFDFEEYPHVLIGGASGGGKSNLINQFLSTLITMNSPEEIRLGLVDMKGGVEFFDFSTIPHLLFPVVKDIELIPDTLAYLRQVMYQRLAAFEGVARDLTTFNKRVKEPIPRIILVIDELAAILGHGKMTGVIQSTLAQLSNMGRSVGVHLFLCTQYPTVAVVPGLIKTNLTLRAGFRMPNRVASDVILDSITAANLPNIRGRVVYRLGGFELTAQVALITEDQIASAVKIAKRYTAPSDTRPAAAAIPSAPPALEVNPKFSRENLIDMALDEFGGKLSATRTHEKVGNEIMPLASLREMVKRVVADINQNGGILEYRGNRYVLSKDRKAHLLKKIDRPIEPPNEPAIITESETANEFDYEVEGEPT